MNHLKNCVMISFIKLKAKILNVFLNFEGIFQIKNQKFYFIKKFCNFFKILKIFVIDYCIGLISP